MATLDGIIRCRKGRAGSNGAWRVERALDSDPFYGQEYELWHYSTRMLVWADTAHGVAIIDARLGHGSVSDQNGLNTAFRALGVPYRYHRDQRGGGARITELAQS